MNFNFTENLDGAEVAIMFFIIGETKKKVLDFSKGKVKLLWLNFFVI